MRLEMTKAGQPASKTPRQGSSGRAEKSSHMLQRASRWLLQAFSDLEASLYTPCHCHETTTSIRWLHCTFLTSLLRNTTLTLLLHIAYHIQPHTHLCQQSEAAETLSSLITTLPPGKQLAGACTEHFLPSEPVPIRASARHTNPPPRIHLTANTQHYTAICLLALRHSIAMDSMRHLSSSLPGSRRRNEQPHQLLADFKAAALSVTNLYKTATAENARSREAGYQDALDDLLAFLDRENMGLMDGEGWRVRRWATERLDDAPKGSEDEEDITREEVVETRSSSPEVQRKPTVPAASSSLLEEEHQRPASEPPQHATQYQQQAAPTSTAPLAAVPVPALDDFSFRSAQAYPTNHNREDNATMDVDPTSTTSARATPKASSRNRHTNHARSRDNNRSSTGPTFNFNLGSGAGGKRKMPYPDFFDISGLNPEGGNDSSRRDGGGRGGKKGRHV